MCICDAINDSIYQLTTTAFKQPVVVKPIFTIQKLTTPADLVIPSVENRFRVVLMSGFSEDSNIDV